MNKYLKYFFFITLSAFILGCESDDDQMVDLSGLASPSNLGASFTITQDNTGLVTITPTGQSANTFTVDFGDGSEPSSEIKPGESVDHIYAEGDYDVVVTGKNLNGVTAEGSQALTVSFRAPENLEVNIEKAADDNYTINVSATADYAAMFNVYFGDVDDEEPIAMMIGETVSHTYDAVGDYDVRVVALSGGAASTEVTQTVEIRDPLFLPIDFESPTKDYTFINFGPDQVVDPVIDNPDPTGINTSAKVAAYTKPAGSEVWAGTTTALDQPIDFSTQKYISVDVWSPQAGIPVIFKIENLADATIFVEDQVQTTVSNQWETLTFDMTAVDTSIDYGRIVLFFNFNTSGTGETYYFDNIQTTTLDPIKLPLTFESENLNYQWNGFGGATGAVIDNPDMSGINTSSRVSTLNKTSGSEVWAGISLNLEEPVDFSNGTTAKMKVWSPRAGTPILLKMEKSDSPPDANGNPSVFVEVQQSTTVAGEWEELSFDLSTFGAFDPSIDYDRVIVFYDFNTAGQGEDFYFDDIRIGDTAYISLFSDLDEDVTVDTWRTSWSISDYEEVEFDGRLTKHYFNLDFVGIETVAEQLDITGMTHFHTDVYIENGTTFRVKLVDVGPDGSFDGGDTTEHEVVFDDLPTGEWVSLDIPLSQFENLANRRNIAQLIYSGLPAGGVNVYLDNIYFHN
ncbi:hypothetical protein MKO06_03990 [Gramella sp. GC03-9]|uniref:PKD/Chitinase domain-containing protein n=1 Tax=Christiangramia oceanisediminis TaxID=2920386 RepID=A0A9X2I1R5_9FLAO|nr:hypothetical protein [Gramella oceanisediminis]MCP9199055.1 hypothetical protein [Gramella oceanisediminis]